MDVCVLYAGNEYFLRGSERDGKQSPPGITIACDSGKEDEAISNVYRFTSILSWFLDAYVDVSGYVYGSHPSLTFNAYRYTLSFMIKDFKCKHTQDLYEGRRSKQFRAFQEQAERKLQMLDSAAELLDLRSPPGNRLEKLVGDRQGQHSIRINKQ